MRVFLDDEKSYIENTHAMIDKLQQLKYVDEDFKNRVINRAKKATMVFDNSVAFPHTINKNGDDNIVISLGISKKGVVHEKVEGCQIKIILLVGLPEKNFDDDDTIMLRIYNEIIAVSQNELFVEAISSSLNLDEVIKNFITLDIGNNL